MKTKVLLISCLFVSLFFNQVNAQKVHPESTSTRVPITYFTFVECDGVVTDLIEGGPLIFHWVSHWINGEYVWDHYIVRGEVQSSYTGEIFKVSEVAKIVYDQPSTVSGTATVRFNLKGNMGNHYISEATVDLITFEFTFNRSVCISK